MASPSPGEARPSGSAARSSGIMGSVLVASKPRARAATGHGWPGPETGRRRVSRRGARREASRHPAQNLLGGHSVVWVGAQRQRILQAPGSPQPPGADGSGWPSASACSAALPKPYRASHSPDAAERAASARHVQGPPPRGTARRCAHGAGARSPGAAGEASAGTSRAPGWLPPPAQAPPEPVPAALMPSRAAAACRGRLVPRARRSRGARGGRGPRGRG